MNKVLLVEDDNFVYELVKISLKDYEVVHCPTLKDAEVCLPKNQWSFIILDLNLPDGDGLRFLAKIKENDATKNVPITILSAETGISHKVMAFDYGVDDYILKPFDPVEFKSRINARVKKFQEKTSGMTRLSIGDLVIDLQLFKTFLKTPEKETDLNLTALEIKILFYMAQKIDRVFSRGQFPVPAEIDPSMKDKTLYVWPDSLIAPISFTKVALAKQGRDPKEWERFWKDPEARIFQFLGQDNVYFYVLMQGAMWIGVRGADTPDYTMTDVYSVFHLLVNGEKMSKSTGNFYTGDQLTQEMNYDADQVRYFLSTLSLAEKQSNFDFETFKERNKFLAGPLNAAIEKPIAAVQSKFGGVIPEGKLLEKAEKETMKIVQMYVKNMEKADHITLLGQIENYARLINSFFVQYKPHDDRHDETERKDALYSCFYILKNLMIMLHPFVPATMDKVRESLNLPASVFSIDELGIAIPVGHVIGQKVQYFPTVEGVLAE